MKKKYIIALEDRNVWSCGFPAKTLLLSDVSIFGTDLASVNTGIELTPYTDPDLEQVRKEAYENGWKEAEDHYEKGYNDGYDTGLSDAWECARKIVDCAIPYSVLENYLEIGECTADVIKHLPASKAIEVVRQYEQEKEEQDGLRQNIQTIVDQCGYTLDEIAEVLKEMREE